MKTYEPVIGLEIHIELRTKTKMFCGCSAAFGGEPNTRICPVCTGQPGALPRVNRDAVIKGMILARELHGRLNRISRFDRKNYFYPDNPKSYQITQKYVPLSEGGHLDLKDRRIRIHEIHLEEDAGKLIHTDDGRTLVNLNRAGVPLAEIVTEPDFTSAAEVTEFLAKLRDMIVYSGISDGKMQEGSMRADVNISVRETGTDKYGTRTEMKNLNSFSEIRHAVENETGRQTEILNAGGRIVQETRRWDEDRRCSYTMRGKEEAADYRYFPEPDLYPMILTDSMLDEAEELRTELRPEKQKRYTAEMGLTPYEAEVLTEDPETAELFEDAALRFGEARPVSSLIGSEVLRLKKETGLSVREAYLTAAQLAELLTLQKSGKITGAVMKELLKTAWYEKTDITAYAEKKGMLTVRDSSLLAGWIDEVISENPGPVSEYLGGKDKVIMFLLGRVMKKASGRAEAEEVKTLLLDKLHGL